MRENAGRRFGVAVSNTVEICPVAARRLIEPSLYPVATLVGQALGSMILVLEALLRLPPDLLIDTTGLAFS